MERAQKKQCDFFCVSLMKSKWTCHTIGFNIAGPIERNGQEKAKQTQSEHKKNFSLFLSHATNIKR